MFRPWLSWVLAVAAALGAGCAEPERPEIAPQVDTTAWVRIYDPAKTWNGVTLALYQNRMPILIDMNGRILKAWPEAEVESRLRLLPDGSLLAIGRGNKVVEYDWEGRLTWEYSLGEDLPHHDLIRLANGNTLILSLAPEANRDDLIEVDREGRVVWKWTGAVSMAAELERLGVGVYSHVNSVQELPDNPWFEGGDERFQPGNLLLSLRGAHRLLIIDRRTGEVVWSFGEGLDSQHEALMLAPPSPRRGRILLFNNRRLAGDRRSEVLEIDPGTGEVTWRFAAEGFYSPIHGSSQPLANGNVLVGSSRGGRAFEVDRSGEVVWEWAPPFELRRPQRYGYDHSPQLAAMPRPEERPVTATPEYRFVDRDAYRFADHGRGEETVMVGEQQQAVLRESTSCQPLFLPAQASMALRFGVRRDGAAAVDPPLGSYLFRFDAAAEGVAPARFEERIDPTTPGRKQKRVDLSAFAFEQTEVCLEVVTESPEEAWEAAYWWPPVVLSEAPWQRWQRSDEAPEDATADELEARRRHLRAMGYVN